MMRSSRPARLAPLGAALLAAVTAACAPAPDVPAPDPAHLAEVEAWRARRLERLQAEDGWLAVVGLAWLEPGENTFGGDPGNAIVLPGRDVPPLAGSFWLEDGLVTLRSRPEAGITMGGEPVTERELATDAGEQPDILHLGSLSLSIIERGGRQGVRIKDAESEARRSFAGIEAYPVDTAWRVTADFVPFPEAVERPIPTVLGTAEMQPVPGRLHFTVDGRELTLEPVAEPGEDLFLIFSDATSGETTYGAGRFLYASPPVDGKVVLDFNKAYNPPCAFTPYATCPLPPPQNHLEVAVTAGEKAPAGH